MKIMYQTMKIQIKEEDNYESASTEGDNPEESIERPRRTIRLPHKGL